jgi:single-stranded DNA-specific DHH superfamily exonuclease
LTDEAALEVLALDPFGHEFPEPLFWMREMKVVEKTVFAQKHLRVRLADRAGRAVTAKMWNAAELAGQLPSGSADALVAFQGNPSGAARGYAAWDLKLVAMRQAG